MTNGRDRDAIPRHDETLVQRSADRHALAADQAVSDADRDSADADQTASDADQAASERDDADAVRDQAASDRDQASADERRAGQADPTDAAYDFSVAEREASRIDRLTAHASRASTVESRLATSRTRGRNALFRDDAAWRREERAILLEERIATSDAPPLQKLDQLRDQAAKDRAHAAADRRRAAAERAVATTELARLQAEMHSAYLDGLTGAFRREIGWHAISLEIERSRRGDGRFVLAFVDVDGLKSVNGHAGQDVGDLVLKTLVATMRSSLRSFDPIARFGDDEFACGIAGVDIDEVDRRFEHVGRSLYADTGVGISVGTAALAPGETLAQVTARADAALLSSKRSRHT